MTANHIQAINDLAKFIHQANRRKGFYDEEDEMEIRLDSTALPEGDIAFIRNALRVQKLALITTETSEAIECLRKDQRAAPHVVLNDCECNMPEGFKAAFEDEVKDTYEDELADQFIRILDLAARDDIDLGKHIALKLRYNDKRPYKHGKKF